jgi:hypothetical protein
MPIIRIDDPKKFIGMDIKEASSQIRSCEYDVRVINKNLVYKPDYDPLRVCLIVEKDKVVDARIG